MAAFAIQAIDQETTHSREGYFMPKAAGSEPALLKRRQIAAFNCANRGLVWTTEHFALMGPVSARLGSVDALARAALGLFARPVLGHLEWAGKDEPGLEHLLRPPMPGID